MTASRRKLVPHARAAALLVLGLAGCAQLQVLTGPKLSGLHLETPPVLDEGLESADHRDRDRLRFLVAGDAGTGGGQGSDQARVGKLMFETCEALGGCDFALMTGDNIYPSGVTGEDDPQFRRKFEEPYRAFGRFDFWMVTGNHDWYRRGSAAAQVRYSRRSERWRMPALDYAVPLLPSWISIYGLDTTLLDLGRDSGQVERARRALCDSSGWRLAFGHHGVYTVGRHGDRSGTIPELERALLEPLIRRCELHVYFVGHDHLQAHVTAPDFEQIVQGAGGRFLHSEHERAERPAGVDVLAARDDDFGFAIVEASPDALEVRFYDLGGGDRAFYCARLELAGFDRTPRPSKCAAV